MTPAARPEIRVFPDAVSLSHAAADIVVSLSAESSAARGKFTIALSGGSTPKHLYALFASSPFREAVSWSKTHVFWADERCVPPRHPDSNYKLAFDVFLSGVPVPAEHIHRIWGEEEPGKAAQAYEDTLRRILGSSGLPVFDLVLLGVGEDGHTASLFSGSAATREKKRLAMPVYVEPPGLSRVTLTLPVLNNAAHVLFLATGHSKAAIVHEVMEDGNPKNCPAGLIQPVHGSVTWMLDREAARALTDVVMLRH